MNCIRAIYFWLGYEVTVLSLLLIANLVAVTVLYRRVKKENPSE